MKEIPLGGSRYVAIVDDEDFNTLSEWNWSVLNNKYTYRLVHNGHYYESCVLMHRFIMGFPPALVDHIDRNGFHNWRTNLRVADKSLNALNAGPQSNNTSGVRGVDYNKHRSKWCARIKVAGKQYQLGFFLTFEEAMAARVAAERSFGLITPNTFLY